MAYKFLSGTLGMPIFGVGPSHLAESVFSGSLLVSSSRASVLVGGGLGGVSASMGLTASSIVASLDLTRPSRFGALRAATVDATTDFTIDGLVLTADTISNDADLTIDCTHDIILSADGGNVKMDDGQSNTVFDFDVDNVKLKIMDDADDGDYFEISTAAAGATTITTVDDDGNEADLIVDVDGEITLDAHDAAGVIFAQAGTSQLSVIDGMLKPTTDNDIDLGSAANSFKDAHIQGTLTVGTVTATTLNATVLDNTRSIGNANANLGTGFNYVTTSLAADRTYLLPATSAADRGMTLTVKANEVLGTGAGTAFKMIITGNHGATGKSNMLIDGAKTIELTTANSAVNLVYVGDHTGGHWKVY